MSKSWARVAATLAAVIGSLVGGAPARAEKPRVAVVGVSGDKATPELRDRVAQALADGLAASGAEVVAPGGAAYRMRGTLEVEGRTYVLRLEMLDAQSGAVIDARDDRCEICTEGEALESAGVAASALKAQVFKKRPPPPPAVTQGPAESTTAVVARPGDGSGNGAPASASVSPHPHRTLGWIGIAAGAVAAAAGAQLIAMHNDPTCSDFPKMECEGFYDTKAGGISLVAAGGLALLAGVLAVAGVF